MNKLELKNQLGRTWEKLLLEYLEDEMRAPSLAKHLLANAFVRTAGQLMFTWSLAGVALEALTSYNKQGWTIKVGMCIECLRSILVETVRE